MLKEKCKIIEPITLLNDINAIYIHLSRIVINGKLCTTNKTDLFFNPILLN